MVKRKLQKKSKNVYRVDTKKELKRFWKNKEVILKEQKENL